MQGQGWGQSSRKAEREGGSPSGTWLLGWALFFSGFSGAVGEVTTTLMFSLRHILMKKWDTEVTLYICNLHSPLVSTFYHFE